MAHSQHVQVEDVQVGMTVVRGAAYTWPFVGFTVTDVVVEHAGTPYGVVRFNGNTQRSSKGIWVEVISH